MKKNEIFKLILIYCILLCFGTIFYISSFHTFLFSFIDVFFYRGIILIIFWGIIITLIMLYLKLKIHSALITIRDIIMVFVLFSSFNVVFFTHVPVTANRSISIFMLGYMSDHSEEVFSEDDIEEIFIEKYVNEYKAFSKRFHEQVVTGTIKKVNGGYQITEKGRNLVKIYELVTDMYGLDKKLIHPTN